MTAAIPIATGDNDRARDMEDDLEKRLQKTI